MTSIDAASLTPAREAASLRARAVRGLGAASLGTAGKTGVDLIAQFVLLRVLAPEHFGVFALAQALSGFVSCFTDFAGQKFLVRAKKATERDVATVFWFELAMGIAVAALWCVAAGPILTALGNPEQVPFARALGLWIVAERLLLPRATMDRAMRFEAVNVALFAGVVAGSIAMIAVALAGGGAWSFVAGLVVRTVASAGFVWRAARFRPMAAFDNVTVRELVAFGGPLLLGTALTFAYTNVDYLIVGAIGGTSALGLYYAAYRYPHYLNQFNILLASVVFPSFSKATDDAHLARGLRLLTRYSAAFSFAPILAMWTHGDLLVSWLLGEKWLAALFPFQCFTTLAGMRLALFGWGQVATVKGRTGIIFRISLVNLPVIAVAAWLGVKWAGIDGAAALVTVVALVTLAYCACVLLKSMLPAFSYGEALRPALYASVAWLAVAGATSAVLPEGNAWTAAGLLASGAAYAGTMAALCGGELLRVMGKG